MTGAGARAPDVTVGAARAERMDTSEEECDRVRAVDLKSMGLRENPVLRYAVAVATIAVLIPLRFVIEPLPSPPFLLTVMVVSWLVGFGPGIVTVVISAVALDYWFIPSLGAVTASWHQLASITSFSAVGVGIVWLTATRRQAEDERTALLAREQASRAAAEAANRAKDEFVAVLGHEFGNPLSAIVNAVQLLDHAGTPEATTRTSSTMP